MNNFELQYRQFQHNPQRRRLSTTFQHTIEEVFETLETEYLEMPTAHSIIYPIANRNFGNKFHLQNETNQRQHVHKYTGQHYQYR